MKAAFLLLAVAAASAQTPATVFTGTRLYLTTTSFETDVTFSTETHSGFYAVRADPIHSVVVLPGDVLDGYVLSSDARGVNFALDSELLLLKYPVPILAVTGHPRLAIPAALIRKMERLPGRFDGRSGVGEPLDLPARRALLMAEKAPFYFCMENYTELKNVAWISYNPRVGKKELAPLCDHSVKQSIVDRLLRRGGVFPVDYPAR